MAVVDLQAENRDLRKKLQQALARCAEMETNADLKKKLEVGSRALGEKKQHDIDKPHKPT